MLQSLIRRAKAPIERRRTDVARTPTMLNFIRIREAMLEANLRSSGLEERCATFGRDRVQYWVGGQGPTVVLLHGFGAHAVWQWYSQVEALTKRFRVVMPNLLWFGKSHSYDPDPSLEHQVQALIGLLDHLGEREIHLCGLSYGGAVASLLSARQPSRIQTLTLAASPAQSYRRQDYQRLCQRFGVRDISNIFVPNTVEDVQRLLSIGYKRPPLVPRFALRQVLDVLYGEHREEKRDLLRSLVGDLEQLASEPVTYEGPVKLIWGREDFVFPIPLAHRLAAQVGERASLTVIESACHAANLEQPHEFNAALEHFLLVGS